MSGEDVLQPASNPASHATPDAVWTPLGDMAVVVQFGDRIDRAILRRVWALMDDLEQRPVSGMIECVAAYTTVTVFFDLLVTDGPTVGDELLKRIPLLDLSDTRPQRTIEIPVCYGGEYGPDLEFVARHTGMSISDIIATHSEPEYVVYLIGFSPGFPYLGGMSPQIAVPRMDSPRLLVPAGSVAIGGEQTGIYPMATPGGWRLIGRTPQTLFRPDRNPPSLLRAGDAVRFRPITDDEFQAWDEPARPKDPSCLSK